MLMSSSHPQIAAQWGLMLPMLLLAKNLLSFFRREMMVPMPLRVLPLQQSERGPHKGH